MAVYCGAGGIYDVLYNSSSIVPASAGTLSFWLNTQSWSGGGNYHLFNTSEGNPGAYTDYLRFQKWTDGKWYAGWHVGGVDYRVRDVTAGLTTGWRHMLLHWTSGGDTKLYQNNSQLGSTTNPTTTTSRTYVYLGNYPDGGSPAYAHMAEVGLWSAVLDAGERAALSAGFTPPQIRPASLVAYWPLGGLMGGNNATAGVLDRWANRYNLTAAGTPTWVDHPRVIYPAGVR